jgi:hypothetical protein
MDGESGRVCSVCGDKKGTEDFSKKQWLAKAHRYISNQLGMHAISFWWKILQ